ncbi:DUF4259 domain-containing protein [Nocardioides zeae]|uniref:DUF4259 domain-containing protein n=1 Tax=Nocardioides imazamoxiresistens TaxID=3231893 RepID=A0ABU3PZ13_9ACTN|nr:DUF4259 domain-containing protein [Nocardioides zeae]MDT9594349.1 DUF4259 domain-containing protein [Nocardioides zeae]
MGTWGTGPFQNDGALDLLGDVEDGTFSFDNVEWAFEEAHLEADAGEFAVALLEIALVALEAHDPTDELAEVDLDEVRATLTPNRLRWLVQQVERTLSEEGSESYELWAEADEADFEAWRSRTLTSLTELRELL